VSGGQLVRRHLNHVLVTRCPSCACGGRVAAADGPKNAKLLRDPKIDWNFTAEHRTVPAITTGDTGHEMAGCDTHNNTQDHTGDANMTSLSIRLTVTL